MVILGKLAGKKALINEPGRLKIFKDSGHTLNRKRTVLELSFFSGMTLSFRLHLFQTQLIQKGVNASGMSETIYA
ncbi:hypothetical protein AYI84_18730 [Shewanella algae]|nr:hypothetical protein AYI84_18730 [Shewanella algae]TVL47340.1 hypothetical protein AYI99_11380 [Shewanella algae]